MIGSSWVFNVYSRLKGDTKFKAGTYELRKNMGVARRSRCSRRARRRYVEADDPARHLAQRDRERVGKLPGLDVASLPRGTQNDAVRSAFEPAGSNNLEGLLWPDTYKVSADEDEIQVLSTMVHEFDKQAVDARARAARTCRGTARTTS